jgi:4-hydroxy-2-oxoheptanedioate aldolase
MPRTGLKTILKTQGYVLNTYISMPGAFAAELYARQGWDAVSLDMQHGLISYDGAVAILQAVSAVDVVPMARIPWLDPAIIMKMLDAGLLGITCPMINTAAEADRLVRYAKYPPRGERSLGPLRASLLDGDGYARGANDTIAVFAMIETAEGLRNLDEILSVDGIDGIYVGPGDLAVSLGVEPRMQGYDPQIERALDRIAGRCAAKGAIAGILAPTAEAGTAMIARGFRFLTMSSDARALAGQASSWVQHLRKHVPATETSRHA